MVIQTATKRLFSDHTSPLTACAQSLDLLPKQYLDLLRPTATHCRLLVNNTHCSAFNDAYNAAMMSISPVCLLSPTQPSSVPKPYDAFVMDWCHTRMTTAPPNTSNSSSGLVDTVTDDFITSPSTTTTTRPPIDVNTLPPPKPAASDAASLRIFMPVVAAAVVGAW
ncbi:hypothetical protein DYB25_005494 [Aphanomyces astaci]|uniref:Uncharacterized protein n=1 Tax=Aphanomyces astaci TaxID=112090 RepID=A0A397E4H5_APHAT|nr:hypothetical protein DYB25_005494 [Aphanomyces astaci]RHY76268.1 hypothetical protein DYB30_012524 [Aphanomyces astaci]RHY79636.1 hypothetical protein DYB26_008643 [Aphanomyces astaci]RHZ41694.1 hypothetical protein DYB31_005349 [Aphanomyces astaci]